MKFIKLSLIWGFLCFFIYPPIIAQEPTCGNEHYMETMLQDPNFAKAFYEQQEQIKHRVSQLEALKAPCGIPLIIPVAVHYSAPITTANTQCLIDQALAQIEQLNLDYSSCNSNAGDLCNLIASCPNFGGTQGNDAMPDDGACIQFCLGDQALPAGEDNIGGYAITMDDYTWTGSNTDTQNNWDGFLNIFVSNAQGPTILGMGAPSGAANPSGDGVYILASSFGSQAMGACTSGIAIGNGAPYNGGAVGTHQVGHYFGLDDTWQDNLADTPPQNCPNYGCGTFNASNCNFTGCQDAGGGCPNGCSNGGTGYSGNFMDSVYDDCMHNFTADQVNVMLATAATQNAWATGKISCYNPWQNGWITYPRCGSSQATGPCGPPSAACYSNLTQGASLPSNENGVADYESSNWIRSTANINTGARVDYDATNYVQLDPGFTVSGGAVFNGFINGCNNGAGGVNLTDDSPNALNQMDTELTPTDTEIELNGVNELGKEYIKILKDAAIKQIDGMK